MRITANVGNQAQGRDKLFYDQGYSDSRGNPIGDSTNLSQIEGNKT